VSAPFVVEMVVAAGLLFGIPDAGTVRIDPAALAAEDAEHAVDDGQATEAWEPTAAQKAAMFFGIPDTETDDINDPGHWAQILGFCDALAATSRPCSYDDGTPECQKALARGRPCSFSIVRALRWMERNEPERSWTEKWGNRPECPPGIHPSSLWMRISPYLRGGLDPVDAGGAVMNRGADGATKLTSPRPGEN
jgi:hypothetical protein